MNDRKNIIRQYNEVFSKSNMELLVLNRNEKCLEQLKNLLYKMEQFFVPSLSSKVNINDYSMKLINNADNFLLLNKQNEIGLLSMYTNNYLKNEAYISSIVLMPKHHGKSLSQYLIEFGCEYAFSVGMKTIKLEVSKANGRALAFYIKNKFTIIKEENNSLVLIRDLI